MKSWLVSPAAMAWETTRLVQAAARRATGDLLFPPLCTFCGAEWTTRLAGRPMLCESCEQALANRPYRACQRCASPVPKFWPIEVACPRCRPRRYHFSQTVAVGVYRDALQKAVVGMKRAAFEPLTHSMGLLLAEVISRQFGDCHLDLIVPVPMHWWRRLTRGTFPAQLLAQTVGGVLGKPVPARLLRCRRKVMKQGTLGPAQRLRNVHNAFSVSAGYDITDASVLLIDDIMTTGATANEAARVLCRAGAREVFVGVVARGVGSGWPGY